MRVRAQLQSAECVRVKTERSVFVNMGCLELGHLSAKQERIRNNMFPPAGTSAAKSYFFLPFFALTPLLFLTLLLFAFAADFPAAFFAGALPKTLSQPLTNFLEAPVCTVYPVIVFLSLIQRHKSRSLLSLRMQGSAGFVKSSGLLWHNWPD